MKVFIAGPRAISVINNEVKDRLKNIIQNQFTIIVGDANGIDKQIQEFCHSQNYSNVVVYASNGKARNNIGHWSVQNVEVGKKIKGFDFYAAKDLAMAETADYGFMICNGKSKGTFNNIINLIKLQKKALLYFLPEKRFYSVNALADISDFIEKCSDEIKQIYHELNDYTLQLTLNL